MFSRRVDELRELLEAEGWTAHPITTSITEIDRIADPLIMLSAAAAPGIRFAHVRSPLEAVAILNFRTRLRNQQMLSLVILLFGHSTRFVQLRNLGVSATFLASNLEMSANVQEGMP